MLGRRGEASAIPKGGGTLRAGWTTLNTAKEETRRILDSLPDNASWEDIQYSIYARERIERGGREADAGKLIDQEEIEQGMERWLGE